MHHKYENKQYVEGKGEMKNPDVEENPRNERKFSLAIWRQLFLPNWLFTRFL